MIENDNYKFLLEIGFTLNEAKVYLTTAIGDLDSYINNTIEAAVNLNK